jgi:hypothetical protein
MPSLCAAAIALFFSIYPPSISRAQFADQSTAAGTSTGSANAYAITINNYAAHLPLVPLRFIPNFTNNGPATINVSGPGTAIAANVFRDISCEFSVAGATTACLEFTGSTAGAGISYSSIKRVRCFGANTCIRNLRSVNVSGEAQFDWNQISDIQTTNNGGVPTNYAVYFNNGSGTGNVYSDMNLVVALGGLYWGALIAPTSATSPSQIFSSAVAAQRSSLKMVRLITRA